MLPRSQPACRSSTLIPQTPVSFASALRFMGLCVFSSHLSTSEIDTFRINDLSVTNFLSSGISLCFGESQRVITQPTSTSLQGKTKAVY